MTIDEMIKRYNIKVAHGSHEGQIHILNTDMVYADKAIDILKSNKSAIMVSNKNDPSILAYYGLYRGVCLFVY